MNATLGFQTFFLLLAGHALVDFPLQGEFIATYKDPKKWKDIPKESSLRFPTLWLYLMSAHTILHGAAVFLIIGNIKAAVLETIAHFVIDYCKCEKWINFHVDQLLHLISKLVWIYLFTAVL